MSITKYHAGLLGLAFAGMMAARPAVWATTAVKVEPTPEKVERGRYLAYHVANCMTCHSEHSWGHYSGPIVAGTEGKGAKLDYMGLDLTSANITPAALGGWTDGELIRAIAQGAGKDGEPVHEFFPVFPYGHMSHQDVESLVVFLRSLPPLASAGAAPAKPRTGRAKVEPYKPQPHPSTADTVAYGKYLVTIGGCQICHGQDLAGGKELQIPGRPPVQVRNLTPVPGTATTARSRDNFIGMFQAFASDGARRLRVPADDPNTMMNWTEAARMTPEDLGAIYDYLKTLPPVPSKAAPAGKP